MLVKNFGDYSYGNSQFVGLQEDHKYWFPYAFKFVAWFIVISSVTISTVVLLLYGMSFGMIKTYLWATAFAVSFLIGIFITAPIRILFLTCLNSIFLKKAPIILRRKIPLSLLSNPLIKRQRNRVLRYRKYNASMYSPTPLCKLQSRFQDIKYNIELRNLTVDTIAYLVFMVAVCYFVLIDKTDMSFYNNEMVSELVLSGKYTNTIQFKAVRTYDMFMEYLNESLLPALLLDTPSPLTRKIPTTVNRMKTSRRAKRQTQESQNDTEAKPNAFGKGWTMNNCIKLLGKPRLRQVRVKGSCKHLPELTPRNDECAPELSSFNVESGDFTLRWDDKEPVGLTESQALPWTYQSAWRSKTLPVFGRLTYYPGGGYILNLARHINDSAIILEYLDDFQWVDMKTRAIFIEFTLYNVNVNLFSVITLTFEVSATGYMIPSYEINTCKFIFVAHELEYVFFVMVGLFAILLFFFFFRESVRIHRTTFKTYMNWTFAVLDLIIVIFGALSFIFVFLRSYYVSELLKVLENSDNNDFVSFFYAAYWHSLSVYIEAVLVFLAAFKLLRLLTFRVIFFQLQATLNYCYKHFFYLTSLQIIFLIAFANFFYLTLINYSEKFSNVGNSLSTLFGRGVAYDDTFDLNLLSKGFSVLTPFFFWLFIIVIALIFVNVFIAIICLYFHVVRNVPLKNKYNILDYIKFYLTKKHQIDILELRYKKENDKDEKDPDVMRLKGGGHRVSKFWRNPEGNEEFELRQILLKDFITENLYDTVQYVDLSSERSFALRNLYASFLTNDQQEKTILRENALKILFFCFASVKQKIKRGETNEIQGPYFSAIKKTEIEIVDRRIFHNMRKVVENLGKEKGWFIEDICDEEITYFTDKLIVLEKKLSQLVDKLPKKT